MTHRNRLKLLYLLRAAFFCAGLGLILLAVFALPLGLSSRASWGTGRWLLLGSGLLSIAVPGVSWLYPRWGRLARGGYRSAEAPEAPAAAVWAKLLTGVVCLALLVYYTWYLTGGTFTQFPSQSTYYDRLGRAFLAGQLSLLEAPPAALAQLTDPYDFIERDKTVRNYLWDASYYQGRYYLYWGAVPGLLAAGLRLWSGGVIADELIVLIFVSGISLQLGLGFTLIRRWYFPAAPLWLPALLTLAAGCSLPLLWLIFWPGVYSASIAGGQFFILGALLSLLWSLKCGNNGLWVTGLCLGLAVNCRSTTAAAAAFLTGAAMLYLWTARVTLRAKIILAAALLLPLAGCALATMAYNAARFGSILETGYRYQLTGPVKQQDYSQVISLNYVLPNLYGYLFWLPQWNAAEFPYLFIPFRTETDFPFFIRVPAHLYYAEPMVGVAFSQPLVWLGLLAGLALLWRGWNWLHAAPLPALPGAFPRWLLAVLAGLALALLAPLMLFTSSSIRYQVDFLPALWLALELVGCWLLARSRFLRPPLRACLMIGIVILALLTAGIGILATLQPSGTVFQSKPEFFASIAQWFNR